MSVYGYIRVSTKRQADNYSPGVQRKEIQLTCARNQLRPTDYLEDLGTSGLRPFFLRPSVKDVAFQPEDVVVASKLDRLGRDMFDITSVISSFRDMGVRVITGDWGEVTDESAQSKILMAVGSLCADLERMRIVERVQATKDHCKAAGIWPGGRVPWGCYLEVSEDGHKRAVELPIRDAMINTMKSLRARGIAFRQIASSIEQQFKDADGEPIKVSHTQVKRLIDE